ncbi:MAG: hypothetical protein KC420_00410, partial [Myxococcales bacterium]|nr:hypothetical protein [Myxococcales bacterium]
MLGEESVPRVEGGQRLRVADRSELRVLLAIEIHKDRTRPLKRLALPRADPERATEVEVCSGHQHATLVARLARPPELVDCLTVGLDRPLGRAVLVLGEPADVVLTGTERVLKVAGELVEGPQLGLGADQEPTRPRGVVAEEDRAAGRLV